MVGTLLMHRQTMGIDSQDLPWPELGGSHHLPLTLFMICHKGCIQMSFCLRTCKLGISKFPKLGHSAFWKGITSCENLQLKWSLKQSCHLCQELFNNMWHTTCTHVFQGDYQLLVVGNQINFDSWPFFWP
jgi:hypothetical protein